MVSTDSHVLFKFRSIILHLFQPFFKIGGECNYCECYLGNGDPYNCCPCAKTACSTGCVCPDLFFSRDYVCCECDCQQPGGTTQGCNSGECGYYLMETWHTAHPVVVRMVSVSIVMVSQSVVRTAPVELLILFQV